jgi:hypothetical protein
VPSSKLRGFSAGDAAAGVVVGVWSHPSRRSAGVVLGRMGGRGTDDPSKSGLSVPDSGAWWSSICKSFSPGRWPLIIWAHVPAVAYGALVEFAGFTCPLTLLENDLHHRAGEAGYRGGFISHYAHRHQRAVRP